MANHITVAGSNRNSGTADYLLASREILRYIPKFWGCRWLKTAISVGCPAGIVDIQKYRLTVKIGGVAHTRAVIRQVQFVNIILLVGKYQIRQPHQC
ncbi:MAG: hypothetical protein KME50_04085 [Nostoc desertorum CM1-VF14]|jgi:hypothetical protein|nr:hypothetical protein [Nostoc desertorum CM1-VF14]